jgi:protein-disulfide isomerase
VSKQAWIIFAAICVAVLGSLIFVSQGNKADVSGADETKIIAASPDNGNIGDHVFGSKEGKTILIEYGDFQCPGCASAYPNLKEVSEEFKDELTFIFRNLPLTSIHPNARAAATAAEAAGLQGKYWGMHDLLYENQNEWSQSSDNRQSFFTSYAEKAGVADIEKFKTDIASEDISKKINFDLALARKIGATSTPTILLNGESIESNVWSNKDELKKKVEEALK